MEIPKTRSRSNSQIDAGGASPLTLLEPGLNLTGKVERVGDYPFALGGFSDVWRGTCHDDGNSENVGCKHILGLAAYLTNMNIFSGGY